MRASFIFIRDQRFFSRPSEKFLARRKKDPYPDDKPYYVLGEPPLGIMYLSSVLKHAGHSVTLTDQCHPEYSDARFLSSVKEERPDLVGVSFLSNMCYPRARDLARQVKAAHPKAKVVFGGVFPTVNARKIIEKEGAVDVVARGEGERIIRELAECRNGSDGVASITFRAKNGQVVENPAGEGIQDLDTIPFPDRDSLDIHFVAALPLDVPAVIWDRPYAGILSSRGCPFDCTYCNCPTFSDRRVAWRSAENVLQELEDIRRRGYGAFTFLDDNFLLKTDRALRICDGMVSGGHSFRWACEGRAEAATQPLFDRLRAAGCDVVMFGVESGSQRVLDHLRKRTKLAEVEKAVRCAAKAKIGIVHAFFIVGTPGETAAEVKASFDFADRLPVNSFNFNSLTAFRGTALWEDAVTRGLIDDDRDWDKMFSTHEIYPEAIPSAELFRLRAKLIKRLIRRKILLHPFGAAKIIRRFLACMSARDLYRFLTSTKKRQVGPRR